jgi:hypothetical protein
VCEGGYDEFGIRGEVRARRDVWPDTVPIRQLVDYLNLTLIPRSFLELSLQLIVNEDFTGSKQKRDRFDAEVIYTLNQDAN